MVHVKPFNDLLNALKIGQENIAGCRNPITCSCPNSSLLTYELNNFKMNSFALENKSVFIEILSMTIVFMAHMGIFWLSILGNR